MLNTIIKGRGTGKTTEVIVRMKENRELFLVTPTNRARPYYPEELHNRMVSFDDLLNGKLRGKRFNKIIIDEGFALQKDKLAKLYYYLGENHIDVDSYGTI